MTDLAKVRSAFEKTVVGDGSEFVGMLAEEVQWTIIGTTAWSKTYYGKESVLQDLLVPLAAQFAGPNIVKAHRFITDQDTVVVEGTNLSITTKGVPYDNRYCWIFDFEDSKVIRVIEYCDTALIEQVLTPPRREAR